MVCIMVGKRFFMAFAQEFLELCRVLSCQSVNSSPEHSASSNHNGKTSKRNINTISEIVLNEDMGNSHTNINGLESTADQNHVLSILRDEKPLFKESKFSPYTPLPAIGKSNSVKSKPPKRIVRQETYRVSNPVYIKGPFDLYKFPSLKDRFVAEDSGLRKNYRTPLDTKNQGENLNNYKKVSKLQNKRKDSIELPKSNFEKFKIRMKNNVIEDKQKTPTSNDNSSSFWIGF